MSVSERVSFASSFSRPAPSSVCAQLAFLSSQPGLPLGRCTLLWVGLLLLRARIKYNFAKKGGKCLRTNVNPARSQQRKREKRREKKKVKEAKGGRASKVGKK
jgi:hypothetical protein